MKKKSLLTSTPVRAVHRPVINAISKWGKSMLISNQLIMKARSLLALVVLILFHGTALADESEIAFDIDAQELGAALNEFALQSNKEILFVEAETADKSAAKVSGTYAPAAALDLLLADTGLDYRVNELDTVLVGAAAEQRGASDSKNLTPTPVLMAQNQTAAQTEMSQPNEPSNSSDEAPLPLEEIIVTGTNIRGAAPVGSPLLAIDRSEIDASGFATTQELVASLPQNFGGGATEETVFGNDAGLNFAGGVAVNLRGLGTDSTLVLINGRRSVQAGGFNGAFVDVSNLPLSAIERVEVLTDGASAVYGSDAIAGVVNFILRDDFDGAEIMVRYGTVTDGDMDEFQLPLLLGKSWDTGNVMLSYEYFERDPLSRTERPFTASTDLADLGGDDFSSPFSNPGNIVGVIPLGGFFPTPVQFAIPAGQDGTSLTPGDLLAGQTNLENRNEATSLLGGQERHSVFVTGRQELGEKVELFGEFRYSNREFELMSGDPAVAITVPSTNAFFVSPDPTASAVRVNYNFVDDFGPQVRSSEVESLAGVFGFNADVTDTWRAEVYAVYSDEDTTRRIASNLDLAGLTSALASSDPATAFNPFGDGSNSPQSVIDSIRSTTIQDFGGSLWSVNGKLDGELLDVPGGAVKLALGGEYREESFSVDDVIDINSQGLETSNSVNSIDVERNVSAVYGELFIPIVGEDNARPGLQRLEITAAGRYEDYSDFGDTVNPKVGVAWAPVEDLVFRGTWGTSFRAPRLTEINGPQFAFQTFLPDALSTTGFSNSLLRQGGNDELVSEESESWTAGIDFKPSYWSGFQLSATYFAIDYTDRIALPDENFFLLALQPDVFASVLTRSPDAATVQSIVDSPAFIDITGIPVNPTDIELIVDGRINNIASTSVSGIDVTADYEFATDIGDFNIGVNANYLLEFENALTPTSPFVEIVDTINNPVDFRMRSNVSWSLQNWGASFFVNYTDGYSDTVSTPNRSVNSWTTVDAQLRYATEENENWYSGVAVSLNLQNLFDEEPPFVNNPAGIGYDPNNADALGRFVSLQVRKTF